MKERKTGSSWEDSLKRKKSGEQNRGRKKLKKREAGEEGGRHYFLGRFEAAVRDLCSEFFRGNGVIFLNHWAADFLFITGLPFFFIIGLSFFFITGLLIFLHHRAAHPS